MQILHFSKILNRGRERELAIEKNQKADKNIIQKVGVTCLVGGHDRLHVVRGEGQLVSEKQGAHKGQLFKLLQVDGLLQKLPLGLQRVELVDKLLRVRQEVVVIILVSKRIRSIVATCKYFASMFNYCCKSYSKVIRSYNQDLTLLYKYVSL